MIRNSAAPTPDLTHGGPVFMSVGQVIELDIVGEHHRRLLEQEAAAATSEASTAAAPDASTTEAAPAKTDAAAAQPSVGTVAAQESTSPASQPASTATTPHSSQPTISAGINAGSHGPLQQHSTPVSAKVGTPGDRYIFTEAPVEYYYYHQPVVKKVQPTQGLTSGGTPIEVSGAWFDQKLDYGVIPYC